LPRLYPRIKMINWFDSNNLQHARPGRQLNNYNLTEQAPILSAYRRLISSPYFLGSADAASGVLQGTNQRQDEEENSNRAETGAAPTVFRPLRAGQKLTAPFRLSIWAKTYVPRPA